MAFSYRDLTVRGRDGRRVAIADCKLEPLNLLIPGNAPIVVPKRNAWRSPSQQAKTAKRSNKLNLEVAQDDYEADSEEEEEEGFDDGDNDMQPLIKNSKHKDKSKAKCKKDSIVQDKASEAKHRRKAERHRKRAEQEREEAAGEHARLQKRIAKQEAYIAKLRARYKNADNTNKSGSKKEASSSKPGNNNKNKAAKASSDTDDGATTDGSAAVREMLANMKIRAGGGDGGDKKKEPRFWAQPGDLPWNVSDDSQLLALKNGEGDNSYAVIAECMGRRAGEVKRRYKYLKDCDFKIPGGDETTEAEKTAGEETTTDVEQTGGETTDDAEKTDDENKDGGGENTDAETPAAQKNRGGGGNGDDNWTEETDTQLWKLKNDGKTWAEIHAIMGGSKSGTKDRYKHLKSIDFKAPDDEKPTDAEQKDDAAIADGPAWGDDFTAMASAYAEKQTEEAAKAADDSRPTKSKKSKKNSNKPKPKPTPTSPSLPSSECGRCPGTNAYIAQYARTLLADANAGRATIPEPDEIFDEDDCILLALADSRRRENRWLEIQADYFNVTGRLVPQEVLRWKLGGEPEA